GWNRLVPNGLALFDRSWGAQRDTATGVIEVVLSPDTPRRVIRVDTTNAGMPLRAGTVVMVGGRTAPAALREGLLALDPGDVVDVDVRLGPIDLREVVGG